MRSWFRCPSTPLGYGCLMLLLLLQHQRSNEIQHGEIPTFLKGHIALSTLSPFPSGRPTASPSWDWTSLRSSPQLQHAGCSSCCCCFLLPSLSLSLSLRTRPRWQENMIDAHCFLFSPTLSWHRVHSSRLKRTQQHLSSQLDVRVCIPFLRPEWHSV